jgi:hypothetical protein
VTVWGRSITVLLAVPVLFSARWVGGEGVPYLMEGDWWNATERLAILIPLGWLIWLYVYGPLNPGRRP